VLLRCLGRVVAPVLQGEQYENLKLIKSKSVTLQMTGRKVTQAYNELTELPGELVSSRLYSFTTHGSNTKSISN